MNSAAHRSQKTVRSFRSNMHWVLPGIFRNDDQGRYFLFFSFFSFRFVCRTAKTVEKFKKKNCKVRQQTGLQVKSNARAPMGSPFPRLCPSARDTHASPSTTSDCAPASTRPRRGVPPVARSSAPSESANASAVGRRCWSCSTPFADLRSRRLVARASARSSNASATTPADCRSR